MGTLTPNEVHNAWEMGSEVIKVLPINNVGGLDYIKAINAVFPFIPLVPTVGINIYNIEDYLSAGAAFVCVGGDLIQEEYIMEDTIIEKGKLFSQIAEKNRRE